MVKGVDLESRAYSYSGANFKMYHVLAIINVWNDGEYCDFGSKFEISADVEIGTLCTIFEAIKQEMYNILH